MVEVRTRQRVLRIRGAGKLGVLMAGGITRSFRSALAIKDHQFFPTENAATVALLKREMRYMLPLLREPDNPIARFWEPACGEGAISEVLRVYGDVFNSDLTHRGYKRQNKTEDFLDTTSRSGDLLVTNPPFSLAEAFIRHGRYKLKVPYMAMFLKSTFFHAKERRELWRQHKPDIIYPLSWRVDFTGGSRPTMECCWYVWRTPRIVGQPNIRCEYGDPLPKPSKKMIEAVLAGSLAA